MNSALVLVAALAGILAGLRLPGLLRPDDALAVVGKLSDKDDVVALGWLCQDLTAGRS
ncbi:MAG: hypothetical protein WCC01_09345 [Acidimicrobiia bacterium]